MSRILTKEEVNKLCDEQDAAKCKDCRTVILEAQRDLSDRENAEAIQQTRRETAKEILTEIQNEFFAEPQYIPASGHEKVLGCISVQDWAALRAKYLPESKKES